MWSSQTPQQCYQHSDPIVPQNISPFLCQQYPQNLNSYKTALKLDSATKSHRCMEMAFHAVNNHLKDQAFLTSWIESWLDGVEAVYLSGEFFIA
jgi:hypothetical protein